MKKLNENLDYLDLKDQMLNCVTVDEYAAKIGKDNEIITLTFTVSSKLAANDLTSWFERGYDFVLDASTSKGELEPGKYLVFVEILRRTRAIFQIKELLSDLETLTGYKLENWVIVVNEEKYTMDTEVLSKVILTNPNVYTQEEEDKKNSEDELNEFRQIAGLPITSDTSIKQDEYITNIKNIAGL